MHVLLLHTPKVHQVWAGVPDVFNDRYAYLFPPLATMSLSASLKAHTPHRVSVMDAVVEGLTFDAIGRRVAALAPEVVAITATSTHALLNVTLSVAAIRAALPGVFIVLGGPHVNAFPRQAARLPGIDAAIRGDGEEPLRRLLELLSSGASRDDLREVPGILLPLSDGELFQHPDDPREPDLDRLPFPDREACPPGQYYTPGMRGALATTMMGSRGCPNRCAFCNVPHRYRARSPENVVEEIAWCVRRHGVQDIHFLDDFFNFSEERVLSISELILRRDLRVLWGFKAGVRTVSPQMLSLARRAGCYRIHYGVETFTDEGLRAMNKKATVDDIRRAFRLTHEAGIKPIAYMILGCPHERRAEDIRQMIPFLHSIKPAYVVFSLFTPYPDAPIFQRGVEKGLFSADCWERFMASPSEDHGLPTAWEEHLSRAELVALFKDLHRRFYLHPATLARTFAGLRSTAELKHVLFGGFQLARLELLRASGRSL